MNIVLVYNPKSGTSLSAKELRIKCESNGIKIIKLIPLSHKIEHQLKPYIEAGLTIAAIGGDGTISSIAGIVAGTKATFAPLPGGTLNHFTKDLGIPREIDKALARLAHAKLSVVDVGSVNNKVFINNVSFGIYPASLKVREEYESRIGKWPAAIVGTISAFIRFHRYNIVLDGRRIKTPFVFVGNNLYDMTDMGVTTRKSLVSGELGVVVVRAASRIHVVMIGIRVILGTAHLLKEFEVFTTKTMTIEAKRKSIHVSHDGEVSKMHLPLTFEIRSKSLRILK
ncbi:MAG: diacylglycerol kinase family protein [Candidatus Saccharimonadales bacterium]